MQRRHAWMVFAAAFVVLVSGASAAEGISLFGDADLDANGNDILDAGNISTTKSLTVGDFDDTGFDASEHISVGDNDSAKFTWDYDENGFQGADFFAGPADGGAHSIVWGVDKDANGGSGEMQIYDDVHMNNGFFGPRAITGIGGMTFASGQSGLNLNGNPIDNAGTVSTDHLTTSDPLSTGNITDAYVLNTGDTMSGILNMAGNDITGIEGLAGSGGLISIFDRVVMSDRIDMADNNITAAAIVTQDVASLTTTTLPACDGSSEGDIRYNGTHHVGCDGDAWQQFY